MKKATLFFLILLAHTALFAQGFGVKGKVTDSNGAEVPGVSIYIKGTTTGTSSNVSGDYSIEVPDGQNSILVFSFIGLSEQEIVVNNQSTINVTMVNADVNLEEVVITALGISREKKSLTYSSQGVNADEMQEIRSDQLINSLSGKAAGVQVVSSSTPTGSNRVIIRGVTSISGNNNPLYVIDGIPLDNSGGDATISNWAGGEQTEQIDLGDPLAQLNPDDVESMEVLKGASASALYGSRAANGVIIITTKKGSRQKNDKWGVTINSNTMVTEFSQFPSMQYVYGSGSGSNVANGNTDLDPVTGLPNLLRFSQAYGSPLLGFDVLDVNGTVGKYVGKPDNVESLYKQSVRYVNSVTLNKAGDDYTFRLTYTNTNAGWMMKDQEKVGRHNLSIRSTVDLTSKLNIDVSMMYTYDKVNNRVPRNGSKNNPASAALYTLPNMSEDNMTPWKDPLTGQGFAYNNPWMVNPYWLLNENHNEDKTNRVIGNTTLSYKITNELSLRAKAMGDIRLIHGYQFENMGASYNPDGLYRSWDQDVYNWNFEGMLSYGKKFDKLSVNSFIGANAYILDFKKRQSTNHALLLPDVASIANNADKTETKEWDSAKRINSLFGSVSLGYANLIYMDLTFRNDWSSSLQIDNASFSYPSVGGSFIFSELLGDNTILSFGKLRGSWAQVGNDANPYQIYNIYNYGGNYNGVPWTTYGTTKPNSNLKNELTTSIEAGLELSLFRNRVSLDVSVYESSTTNQILTASFPSPSGFQSALLNGGELENKGVEIHGNVKVVDKRFKWDVDVNWSKNRTDVVSLTPEGTSEEDALESIKLNGWLALGVFAEKGEKFGTIRGIRQLKDPVTGARLVNPLTGLPITEHNQILGNVQADWFGSIKNSFKYKNFTFSALIDVKIGGDMFSATEARKQQFGTGISSLKGRDGYLMSFNILGETNNERMGTGLYGNDYNSPIDDQGFLAVGEIAVKNENDEWVSSGVANNIALSAQQAASMSWVQHELNIFDASFVKLRELSFGYNIPKSILKKTNFFETARISIVGRNLAILHQNTPKGIDPEAATNSTNRGLGIEFGSFLPSRNFGFNINFSF
jgi:TonB-linked SusC/RagA family outer membrane protein